MPPAALSCVLRNAAPGRTEEKSMNEKPDSVGTPSSPTALKEHTTPRPRTSVIAWFGQVLPTLLVLGVLGGFAYWGHHTGWKIPKFSALIGRSSGQEKDWCPEHSVPESQCVECNADLLPKGKAPPYCRKH